MLSNRQGASCERTTASRRLRRRLQFSLRSVFIVFAVASIPLAWLRWRSQVYTQEENAIAQLRREGAQVSSEGQVACFLGIPLTDRETCIDFFEKQPNLALTRRLRRVVALGLYDLSLPDEGASVLGKLQELTLVSMRNVRADEHLWASLGRLKRLEWLFADETAVPPGGMAHLSDLMRVHTVYMRCCDVRDEDLQYLRGFLALVELRLTKCPITGSGLRHVQHLPKLEILDLSSCEVTDEALDGLLGFPSLCVLRLADNRISDNGVRSVARISSLRVLDLSDTLVTDASIPALLQLGNLEELTLEGTRVTEDGWRRLVEAIPSLRVRARPAFPQDASPSGEEKECAAK